MGTGVYAVAGTTPDPGHPLSQLQPCSDEESLITQNGVWTCVAPSSIPSGAVMAFNLANCPSGWSEYTSARGRVIVGLEPNDGDFDSREKTGGEKTHTLTIAEMPAHNHYEFGGRCTSGCDGHYGAYSGNPVHYLWTPAQQRAVTSSSGGSQPHNNLQPYIALLYCQKN